MTEAICFEIETESKTLFLILLIKHSLALILIKLLSKKGQNSQKCRSKAEKDSTLRYFNSK